jgi:hypothetical protein
LSEKEGAVASQQRWPLKFVRWGIGLSVIGLLSGFMPLGHYLLDDAIPSCPSAPIHGHLILLSFVGMPMFGLIYQAMPNWSAGASLPLSLVRLHFRLSVAAVIGVLVNGTIVYEILGHFVQPGFYYDGADGQTVRNIWFGIDGAFLTLYGVGCLIFLNVLRKHTSYASEPTQVSPIGTDRLHWS